MPVVKVLEHFPSTENYQVGEEYDITNPEALIKEGKVELVDQPAETPVEPVSAETPEAEVVAPVTEGSQPEGADAAPVEEPVVEAPVEAPVEVETPTETPAEAPVEEAPTEIPTETETVE